MTATKIVGGVVRALHSRLKKVGGGLVALFDEAAETDRRLQDAKDKRYRHDGYYIRGMW